MFLVSGAKSTLFLHLNLPELDKKGGGEIQIMCFLLTGVNMINECLTFISDMPSIGKT